MDIRVSVFSTFKGDNMETMCDSVKVTPEVFAKHLHIEKEGVYVQSVENRPKTREYLYQMDARTQKILKLDAVTVGDGWVNIYYRQP